MVGAQSALLTHGLPLGKCALCACRTCCLTSWLAVAGVSPRRKTISELALMRPDQVN